MRKISDLINRFQREEKKDERRSVDEKTIFFIAEKTIKTLYGIKGKERVSPRFFRDGKLFFSAESSMWANEVWIEREKIRNSINSELGQEEVREIMVSGKK